MLRSGSLYAPPGSGLSPVYRAYLSDPACRARSQKTKASYITTWRLLQERFPQKRFSEFTEADLIEFFTHDRAGVPVKVGSKGWTEWTFLTRMNGVTAIFSWGFRTGVLPDDPSKNLRTTFQWVKPRSYRQHIWLKLPEVERLMSVFDDTDPISFRDHAIVQTLVGTGVRCNECTDLRWEHVLLDAGELYVADGKGHKARYVPLTAKTRQLLLAWHKFSERAGDRPLVAGDAVFPIARSVFKTGLGLDWAGRKWLEGRGILDAVKKAGTAIGHPRLRPHDLRRSYAGILEDAGVVIQDISRNLGHASLQTTLTYLESNPSKRQRSIANVDL